MPRRCSTPRFFSRVGIGSLALVASVLVGVVPANASEEFFDLDLQEVLMLEVTTASKKPQTVSQAAAAVFVLTAEDIRRSPAKTVPDLLRTVPGVQVASINANTWAVSSRGIDGRFTNKLLVLIDGRSVYSQTFSGVYWDIQDTVLEDIDRIEVIRGPGATLWGANAVNGVINIITKSAASTQGTLLSVAAGNEDHAIVSARHGARLGEIGHWRLYGKGFRRDGSTLAADGRDGGDDWRQWRSGFRVDLAPQARDAITVQGDYYRGRSGETTFVNTLTPPFVTPTQTEQHLSGYNLLLRWQRELSALDSFTVQGYLDHSERDWPAHVKERRTTVDADLQYRTRKIDGHDLVMGLSYRRSLDDFKASTRGVPAEAQQYAVLEDIGGRTMTSVFIQDDISLHSDRIVLTVGGKLERDHDNEDHFQPNARLLWRPQSDTTLWGSVARAVRTPSRIDRNGRVNQSIVPPLNAANPLPLPVLIAATGEVDAERLTAFETGIKHRFYSALSADLALFYNRYRGLRSGTNLAPACAPSMAALPACLVTAPGTTHVLQLAQMGNDGSGAGRGLELSIDWRPSKAWRAQANYSRLKLTIDAPGDGFSTDRDGSAPREQGSLRLAWSPRPQIQADAVLRHVARLDSPAVGIRIPSYTELDLRFAWQPRPRLELAIAGRNLLRSAHAEFASELADVPIHELERSLLLQVSSLF